MDRGTDCNMEGSSKYIAQAVAVSRQGLDLQLGVWVSYYLVFTLKTGLVALGLD
jgi:hypothetical protein